MSRPCPHCEARKAETAAWFDMRHDDFEKFRALADSLHCEAR